MSSYYSYHVENLGQNISNTPSDDQIGFLPLAVKVE